jgi:hypothetical protein
MESFLPVDTDGVPQEKIIYSLHKKDIKITGHFLYSLQKQKDKGKSLGFVCSVELI